MQHIVHPHTPRFFLSELVSLIEALAHTKSRISPIQELQQV